MDVKDYHSQKGTQALPVSTQLELVAVFDQEKLNRARIEKQERGKLLFKFNGKEDHRESSGMALRPLR